MTELSDLPPSERIQRYRELAAAARKEAAGTTGYHRESYLTLADDWDRLASTLETWIERGQFGD